MVAATGLPEAETKGGRRKPKFERQGFRAVQAGLGLHFVAMFVLWLGMWAGLTAAVLGLLGLVLPGTLPLAGLSLMASAVLVLVAGLMEWPSELVCLAVPDSRARHMLVGALAVRLIGFASVAWIVLGPMPIAGAALLFLATYGPWCLWMAFLHRLAVRMEDENLADEVWALVPASFLVQLVAALIVCGVALFVVVLIALENNFARLAVIVIAGSTAAGVLRAVAMSGSVDSLLMAILYPTGIPFMVSYMNLVGSLRSIVQRELRR
jgi:hypothetical protein